MIAKAHLELLKLVFRFITFKIFMALFRIYPNTKKHYLYQFMNLLELLIFQLTQRDIENSIDRETSGDFNLALYTMGVYLWFY